MMLCQSCGKHPATTHIQRTVNGVTKEYHLCAECAANLQLTGFSLTDLLGDLFMEPIPHHAVTETRRCPGCGCSFADIAHAGKAGCPQCYEVFYEQLLPSLQRIHGKTRHVGRVPESADRRVKAEDQLKKLKAQMEDAVSRQDFEEAARLRDEIKKMEGEDQHE